MNIVEKTCNNIKQIKQLACRLQAINSDTFPVEHHFSDGVYLRELRIPAGIVIIGKIHKENHLNIVKGFCSVFTPLRKFEIEGFKTFESFAGELKVVITKSDVVWTNVHVTDSTNIDDIEKQCTADDYDELLISKLIEPAIHNKLGGIQ